MVSEYVIINLKNGVHKQKTTTNNKERLVSEIVLYTAKDGHIKAHKRNKAAR